MNRKAFITRLARFGLFGVLSLVTAVLALKRPLEATQSCGDDPACGKCPVWKDCNKPQALKTEYNERE